MALFHQEFVLGFGFVQGLSPLCRLLCGHDGEWRERGDFSGGKVEGFSSRWAGEVAAGRMDSDNRQVLLWRLLAVGPLHRSGSSCLS